MQPFEIVRPGKATASNGTVVDFSEDALKAAVSAYDPAISRAPIVIGHPKENAPAFGWIGALSFAEDGNVLAAAETDSLNADFVEMVKTKKFRHRSASWYLPDSPANPKPGTLYLRHVGFLGAQPPAIKGLKDVSFSEDEGVVEFMDSNPWAWSSVASMFRSLRDWMIGEKGMEIADKVLPNYTLSDLEAEARKMFDKPPAASFSEETSMTPQEIQALKDKTAALESENATLKANQKPADFAERETSIAAREKALAKKEVEARIDTIIADGRLLPARKAATVDFCLTLDDAAQTVDFAEGDKTVKVSQREAHLRFLAELPKAVDFTERSGDDKKGKAAEGLTDQQIADRAASFREDQQKKGIVISVAEAVAAVHAGTAK